MAARSTGIFPREGFNLDNSFAVFGTSTEAPVNMRNCRTLRVTLINPVATGDGIVGVNIGGTIFSYDAAATAAANGRIIIHVRGYSLANNTTQQVILENTGTATIEGCFVELVDGPAR